MVLFINFFVYFDNEELLIPFFYSHPLIFLGNLV